MHVPPARRERYLTPRPRARRHRPSGSAVRAWLARSPGTQRGIWLEDVAFDRDEIEAVDAERRDQSRVKGKPAVFGVVYKTEESDAMSKALKKRGFRFCGPTIVYAFMQAVGMVNDHMVDCHRHDACAALAER